MDPPPTRSFLGTGFHVDPITAARYGQTLEHIDVVQGRQYRSVMQKLDRADREYYNSKGSSINDSNGSQCSTTITTALGWFSCNDECQANYQKVQDLRDQKAVVESKIYDLQVVNLYLL